MGIIESFAKWAHQYRIVVGPLRAFDRRRPGICRFPCYRQPDGHRGRADPVGSGPGAPWGHGQLHLGPVVVGFTAGAGILIFVNQIRNLLGLHITSSPHPWEMIPAIAAHIAASNLPSLWISVGVIALLLILRKVNRKLPAPLIAIVVSALLVFLTGLDERGVSVDTLTRFRWADYRVRHASGQRRDARSTGASARWSACCLARDDRCGPRSSAHR
ncbi:MAG TPA: SulP family inorganic anion transporter [Chloroflexi bacterium]|nr:SulP family inorganic anion transporter [Chloroflexota bacterium]